MSSTITIEEFVKAAKDFRILSDKLHDGWTFTENEDLSKCYLRKETFIKECCSMLKAELVVFYNLAYGVPSLSFNLWNASGALLTLEEIRQLAFTQINRKDFYSVITQQEHPIFSRPYYIMHPCHTEVVLAIFKDKTKNLIVTLLGLNAPLIPQFQLKYDYGL